MTSLQFWTVLSFGVVIGAAVATVITILAMSRKGDDDDAPLLSVPQEDLAWSRPGDRLDAFVEGMVDRPPGPRSVRDADRRGPAAADAGDWRDTMTRELDPARLDLEAAEQYLPGPVSVTATGQAHWAGELHHDDDWWQDYARSFPAILHFGQPGSGDAKTETRAAMFGMTVWNRVEAARRALAVECGIAYRPMDWAA